MNTDIVFNYRIVDQDKHESMTRAFIHFLRDYSGTIINSGPVFDQLEAGQTRNITAICPGFTLTAYGVPAFHAMEIFGETMDNEGGHIYGEDYPLEIRHNWDGIGEIVRRTLTEFKLQPGPGHIEVVCQNCKRSILLHDDQRCCTFCGQVVIEEPIGTRFRLCLDCPQQPGHWVYLPEVIHCPRCGRRNQKLPQDIEDGDFFEYRDAFLADNIYSPGISLGSFEFEEAVIERFGLLNRAPLVD